MLLRIRGCREHGGFSNFAQPAGNQSGRARVTTGMIRGAAAVAVVVALAAVVSSCSTGGGEAGSGGAGSCAALMDFQGVRYTGYGVPTRVPVAGKRLGTGTLPPCNDTGPQRATESATPVIVHRIEGVDPSRAVLTADDQLWVAGRRGEDQPLLRAARRPVPCDLPGPTTITGTWTGVDPTRRVRFDGDVRPPFRMEFVTSGAAVVPQGWRSVTLRASAPRGARTPTPAEVRALMYRAEPAAAMLHCARHRFVLDALGPAER